MKNTLHTINHQGSFERISRFYLDFRAPRQLFLNLCFVHLGSLFMVFQVAFAQTLERPQPQEAREFRLSQIDYKGTGCQPGSVVTQISEDAQAFTMIFSDFSVDNSDRAGRPERRACVIDVRMAFPRGWAFALYGVQVRGYAAIESGAVGVIKSLSSFGARPHQEIGKTRLVGPFDENFEQFSSLPLPEVEWSGCGPDRQRRFNIKTAIVVRPQRGYSDNDGDTDPSDGSKHPRGTISIDSIDGGIAQKFFVAWRRCR
jgi:hypothetical protein